MRLFPIRAVAACTPHLLRGVVLCALSGMATAADKDGNYDVWGPGGKSCHTYNQAAPDTSRDSYRNYVMGYLTAYNAVSTDTYGISGDMNLDAVMTWLNDYCEQKPMHSFEQALIDFTSSHTADRYTRPPGRVGR